MFHMVVLGVGATIAVACAIGWTCREAAQANRAYNEAKARVPVLKEIRSGARYKAGFWIVAATLVVAILFNAHPGG